MSGGFPHPPHQDIAVESIPLEKHRRIVKKLNAQISAKEQIGLDMRRERNKDRSDLNRLRIDRARYIVTAKHLSLQLEEARAAHQDTLDESTHAQRLPPKDIPQSARPVPNDNIFIAHQERERRRGRGESRHQRKQAYKKRLEMLKVAELANAELAERELGGHAISTDEDEHSSVHSEHHQESEEDSVSGVGEKELARDVTDRKEQERVDRAASWLYSPSTRFGDNRYC